jgi:hypothetical protein
VANRDSLDVTCGSGKYGPGRKEITGANSVFHCLRAPPSHSLYRTPSPLRIYRLVCSPQMSLLTTLAASLLFSGFALSPIIAADYCTMPEGLAMAPQSWPTAFPTLSSTERVYLSGLSSTSQFVAVPLLYFIHELMARASKRTIGTPHNRHLSVVGTHFSLFLSAPAHTYVYQTAQRSVQVR